MPPKQTEHLRASARAAEGLTELAGILALGLMRLRARKSSDLSRHTGESPLHFSAEESARGGSEILRERRP